ncbi:unnamed protein product [Closterium sp. Naga37s-1]|nr:unnamed protein product [Closterium sp. Naga37s-1]
MAIRSLAFNELYGSIPTTLTQVTFLYDPHTTSLLFARSGSPSCTHSTSHALALSNILHLDIFWVASSSSLFASYFLHLAPLFPDMPLVPSSSAASSSTSYSLAPLLVYSLFSFSAIPYPFSSPPSYTHPCQQPLTHSPLELRFSKCGRIEMIPLRPSPGTCHSSLQRPLPQLPHRTCQNKNYSSSQPILPPASILTKGTKRETRGNFTAAPVTLFVYEAEQTALWCGLQLAFHANFTFSLSPRSGRVGFNGFAFVVSATDRVGSGAGVGYGGMDTRSVAVEFDTRQDKQHGDMSSQHVGLNIRGEDKSLAAVRSPSPLSNRKAYTAWVDYEPGDPGTIQVFLADSQEKPQEALLERRLALCEVLQGAAEQPAFFFGFVASTTVKPFQRHVILESAVDTVLAKVRVVLVKVRVVLAKVRVVLAKVRVVLAKVRVVLVKVRVVLMK